MFTKTNLIKIVIAILTIGITVMNIAAVSSLERRSEDLKAEPVSGSAFTYDKPVQLNGEDSFTSLPIPEEIKAKMMGNSYGSGAKISMDELNYVRVLYYGFDGQTHQGELIVSRLVSGDILEIFSELYDKHYPIAKMTLIDAYKGDDEASMADNNTSAFNWRNVGGSGTLSMHAYGLAVDINPLMNPVVMTKPDGTQTIRPPAGEAYSDRNAKIQGLIMKGDVCYEAFISRGWQWGGDFASMKDYQHFYKSL